MRLRRVLGGLICRFVATMMGLGERACGGAHLRLPPVGGLMDGRGRADRVAFLAIFATLG